MGKVNPMNNYNVSDHLLLRSIFCSAISCRHISSLGKKETKSASSLLSQGWARIHDEKLYLTDQGKSALLDHNRYSLEQNKMRE